MVRHVQTDVIVAEWFSEMRIAVVDMLFSWPPHGGADVDAHEMISGLQRLGHEMLLVGVKYGDSWERGAFKPDEMPYAAKRLNFTPKQFTPENVCEGIVAVVDAFKPDVVVVGDGFFLKPYVIVALAAYPIVSRYYAYEFVCQKDILHFRNGKACEKAYLETPDFCRQCAFDSLGPKIKKHEQLAWTIEYVAARAYSVEYYALVQKSCEVMKAAIVYNTRTAAQIGPHCANVHVVPGGVDVSKFEFTPIPPTLSGERKIILMTGRAEDPSKGLDTLREAGKILAAKRNDFVIQVTLPEDMPESEWFEPVGWRTHAETLELYKQARICVVPSIWEEPFGLVALEAMACGRPVVASSVGGLKESVQDGVSGFHFPAEDATALAGHLERLLDDDTLCAAMGAAGRRRVEEFYSWERIVRECYLPILEAAK